jgi:hydroxymethylpyrimidine pyrophosphatase-like HAD family hydrolase
MSSHLQSKVSSRELEVVISLKIEAWHNEKKRWSKANTGVDSVDNIVRQYCSTRSCTFNGLATDFDGTLASIAKRDDGPPAEVLLGLRELLKKGCILVVITGRGKSVKPFFKSIAKKSRKTYLCLYNGAKVIQGVKDNVLFEKRLQKSEEINKILLQDSTIGLLCKRIDAGEYGIQVFPRDNKKLAFAFSRVRKLIREHHFDSFADISSSGWTIDITPKDIDKGHALDTVINAIDGNLKEENFLKLGDQGHQGGNDFKLLNKKHAFSVDTISGDLNSCFPVVDSSGKRLFGPEGACLALTRTIFQKT